MRGWDLASSGRGSMVAAPERGWQNQKGPEEKEAANYQPYKALPLINVWDSTYKVTYHQDFEPNKADGDLSGRCPLTSLTIQHHENLNVMHGEVSPDMLWMLSPPIVPVAGATKRGPDEVKVMAYHGLCYSHSGLVDPVIMPAYVAKAKWLHEKAMEWTTLDPVLPKWSSLSTWLSGVKWALGHDMQGYGRPDGAERSMVYQAESNTQVAKPKVVKQLGARHRSASQVARDSREAVRQPSEARSDKAAYDEEERRSSVHSARAVLKERPHARKASGSRFEKPEEPAKRKHRSKHGSKKEAKRATRSRRSHDPEEEEWELDLGDEVLEDKLRETLTRTHRATKGLRGSSDKANSAVSQTSHLMTQVGKQQREWAKARNAERGWLQEENQFLKDIVGWKKRKPREPSPPRSDPEEDETDSLEEDELENEDEAKKSVSARPGPILEGTLGSRMGPGRAGMAPTSGPGWVRNTVKQSTWRIWTGPPRTRDGTWTGPG